MMVKLSVHFLQFAGGVEEMIRKAFLSVSMIIIERRRQILLVFLLECVVILENYVANDDAVGNIILL